MVRFFPLILIIAAAAMQGCQTPSTADMPGPNFNAPPLVLAARPPAPVQYQPPVSSPVSPKVTSKINVPRDWMIAGAARPWRWIVIHHSATPNGSVAAFDRMHKQKGWDECGYHFVIGNGDGAGDGQIEVGPRWPKQKWGAHAKTPDNKYNEFGIGICLVGNFENSRPTAKQQQSLARLTSYLMRTYGISSGNIVGHQDTGKSTACPGRYMNVAAVRKMATSYAEGAAPMNSGTYATAGELLVPVR